MGIRTLALISLACSALCAAPPPSGADAPGLALGRVRELRLAGRVVEHGTGIPLSHAEVTVETDRARERFVAGYDGSFTGVVSDPEGLGMVTVAFAHGDHRAKTLDTVAFELVPKNVDAESTGGRVRVKAKKVDLSLGCGGRGSVASRDVKVDVAVVCEDGLAGVEYAKDRNRFAILASGPFSLRVGGGRMEVRDTDASSVTLRAEVALRVR
jgi:hypothetical protein